MLSVLNGQHYGPSTVVFRQHVGLLAVSSLIHQAHGTSMFEPMLLVVDVLFFLSCANLMPSVRTK